MPPVTHVSYSSWQSFRNGCQFRWKLDYLDGHRKQNYGVHMDFGTAIHETIECFRSRDPVPGINPDISVFLFQEKFKHLYSLNSKFYKEKDLETPVSFFLEAGERIIRRFDECKELATAEVVYNEHKLLQPIGRSDDLRMNFKGFIDMVIKTKDARGNTIIYVCDFKTASWGWSREKREDKELHFQILLYKHFLVKKFNLDPKMVRTAFVLLKKRPANGTSPIEWFPISAGPVSVQRAVDALNADLTEMDAREKSGKFEKNRSECINTYGEACPYKSSVLCPDDV